MPVYIRKNISYTPPSLVNFDGEDNDDDFIIDPEQTRDTLPQPYRMLDKVLRNILDDVWENIAARESERLVESNRVRPPRYECSVQMKNLAKATCLSNTEDGQYIFVGLQNGLTAVEANSQRIAGVWEDDSAEIVQIKTSELTTNMYLISTVDDMGLARLFVYVADSFYFLKLLNEQDASSNKVIASQCEASKNGDYVGVVLENPGSSNIWLEVHRLPKEMWLKELESFLPKKTPSTVQTEPSPSAQAGETVAAEGSEVPEKLGGDTADTKKKNRNKSALSIKRKPSRSRITSPRNDAADTTAAGLPAPVVTESTTDKAAIKFSQPTLVLKIKGPVEPPALIYRGQTSLNFRKGSGSSGMTIYQASKAADHPDVIGTGVQHLLSQQHVDQRQAVFKQCHEEVKPFMSRKRNNSGSKKIATPPQPTFHFLTAGRLMTTGIEQPGPEDRSLGLAVWWAGSSQVFHYALLKGGKDIEYKPDIVWPFSCTVTSSAVSPCTSIVAVGLDNGNIVIWDRYIGIERGVLDVSNSPVKQICFLDPSICPQDGGNQPGFGKKIVFYLLALCGDGCLYLKRCGGALSEVSKPVQLTQRNDDGETITLLKPLTAVPRVALQVQRNGSIYLQDIITGHVIFQAALPESHDTATPWQPMVAVGGGGQMLYVKGDPTENKTISDEEETTPEAEKSVFVFQLRSFPSLDKFWETEDTGVPFVVPSKVSTQVDVSLNRRSAEQAARKSRLESRWAEYTRELGIIRQQREKRRMASAKSSFAESSIPRTPILVLNQHSYSGMLSR